METLTFDEIEEMNVVELPDRELMSQCAGLVNVCIGSVTVSNLLNNNTVTVQANVCGVLAGPTTCTINP